MFFRDCIVLRFLVLASSFGFFFPGLASSFGVFRLLFSFHTHHVGFSACFSLAAHRLLFTFLFQLPVLGFFACFSASKHTSWVFLLAFYSLHPDCSPLSSFSFRFWVFSPVFRLPNTPRGFFRLLFTRYTQIALHFPDLASGFGFFRLFFGFQTHHVGFSACFSLATHIRQRNRHAPIRLLAEQPLTLIHTMLACILHSTSLTDIIHTGHA